MYFKDFPKFLYDFKYGTTEETQTSVVLDITRNIRFRQELLSNVTVYDEYDIRDGETMEIIAEKVYGNPNYHWILMLANDRYDYLNDFPLQTHQLEKHCATKYNPELVSNAGSWYFSGGKLWFSVANPQDAFDPRYLTTSVSFTVNGATAEHGAFSISKIWGTSDSGIDSTTQQFWVKTTTTGTPTGALSITTSGRENNPVYWLNADGFKVSPGSVGSIGISGVQEEERANEAKRRIKIISPDLVGAILKQFKDAL